MFVQIVNRHSPSGSGTGSREICGPAGYVLAPPLCSVGDDDKVCRSVEYTKMRGNAQLDGRLLLYDTDAKIL